MVYVYTGGACGEGGEINLIKMEEIKIKSFATEMEAELAKNMLQAYGIKSRIQTHGVHSSGIPNDRYGADLIVLKKVFNQAEELLK